MKNAVIQSSNSVYQRECKFTFYKGLQVVVAYFQYGYIAGLGTQRGQNDTLEGILNTPKGPDLSSNDVGVNSGHCRLSMFDNDTYGVSMRKRGEA